MNKLSLILSAAALAWAGSISSQKVYISPKPQNIEWGDKAFDRQAVFNITGEKTADADAIETLRKAFPKGKGIKLSIGERGDKAVAKVASKIPDHPQGYYLKISPKEVVIAGNDATGTYYGVQTFLTIASQPQVMSVEITDWPMTPNRGVVEGFYGNAWSFDDRAEQMDFYGRNKMDTYIYGPKDDPYHRNKWRELYPEEDAARLKALNDIAKHHKVKFVWGIHPAADHSWQEDDNLATIHKFESMYDLGIRNFAIFFDDVWGEQADGKKHAALMEYVRENFVKKHPDIENFIMCPSLYNKSWVPNFKTDYLADISKMDPEIKIMWTGDIVVDMIDAADMEFVNPRIGRKGFVWLNYPVTDFCIDHLLLGPFIGNEKEATALVSGFTANPMEFAEASKVSLYGTADFLWNPDAYDADEAWEKALESLVPEATDAFREFCTYNVDLGPNGHNLRRLNETPRFKALIDRYGDSLRKGYSQAAVRDFTAEFNKIKNASSDLLNAAPGNRLLTEIKPWLESGELLGKRGLAAIDMYNSLIKGDERGFIDSYVLYSNLTDLADAITARDFEGSLKVAHPKTGTLYVDPFIRQGVKEIADHYKANHKYRLDVFPTPAPEETKEPQPTE